MSIEEKLETFFETGLGKHASSLLRDGAHMQILIDEKPYSLEKENGEIKVKPGSRPGEIVSLQYTSEALNDLLASENFMNLKSRVIKLRVDGKAKLRLLRKDKRSLQEYFWMGTHEAIRRLGFH